MRTVGAVLTFIAAIRGEKTFIFEEPLQTSNLLKKKLVNFLTAKKPSVSFSHGDRSSRSKSEGSRSKLE